MLPTARGGGAARILGIVESVLLIRALALRNRRERLVRHIIFIVGFEPGQLRFDAMRLDFESAQRRRAASMARSRRANLGEPMDMGSRERGVKQVSLRCRLRTVASIASVLFQTSIYAFTR